MKKKIILVFALVCACFGVARHANAQYVYTELFDSVHVVSATLVQVAHHSQLQTGDYTTSHGFVAAEWPAKTPFVYTNNHLDTAWEGNTYYVENVTVARGKSYGFTVYGTHAMDTTQVVSWSVVITITIPPAPTEAETVAFFEGTRITPNPITVSAQIHCADYKRKTFKFFDMTGRMVKEIVPLSETTTFDKSDFAPGAYIITDGTYVQKILIQ